MSRKLATAVLALVCAALLAAPALAGTKTVHVRDFAYSTARVDIRHGGTVVWKWDNTEQAHDVKATRVPKGAKKFHSALRYGNYTYKHRFMRKGTYRLVCSVHNEMQMKVVVR